MKFTAELPLGVTSPVGEFQSVPAIAEMAGALERAGIDACFVTDHPAPDAEWLASVGHDALDPFTGLAFAAAATSRLKLHTNLVVLPYRNPFITAKAAATLDVLSDGRLIMGCGVGYLKGEYAALGVDFAARGALMDEAIRTMKAAWGDGDVVVEGRGFTTEALRPRPRPVQQPHPPIWAGGNSDRALRRAASLCDGWSPMFANAAMGQRAGTDAMAEVGDLKRKIERLSGLLADGGRTGPFDICIGPRTPLKACNREEADRLVEQLAELAELGVTWTFCGVPHPSRAEFLENVRWFGEEVVPRVHAIASPGLTLD